MPYEDDIEVDDSQEQNVAKPITRACPSCGSEMGIDDCCNVCGSYHPRENPEDDEYEDM